MNRSVSINLLNKQNIIVKKLLATKFFETVDQNADIFNSTLGHSYKGSPNQNKIQIYSEVREIAKMLDLNADKMGGQSDLEYDLGLDLSGTVVILRVFEGQIYCFL